MANTFISDFCEAVIADRSGNNLTDDECQQAIDTWDSIVEDIGNGSPMIADGFICDEFELPRGSHWQMCFAVAMDLCAAINGDDHERLLETALAD